MNDRDSKNPFQLHIYGPPVEPSERWVRVEFGGKFVADSRRPLLLRQYGPGSLPTYYFPAEDTRLDKLTPAENAGSVDGKVFYNLQVGDRTAPRAAWRFDEPPGELRPLKGWYSFAWHKMDAWFEEEEEVFVHARDPHKRVDVMTSSRHVRVEVDGVVLADTRRPALLFETSLPTRFYIPPEDVRMELLQPSRLQTRCPYKGLATYWSVKTESGLAENIVWAYPDPIPECPKIKGLVCFFNEKVDIYLDGELQERPASPWS